jgi:hypothetical protein
MAWRLVIVVVCACNPEGPSPLRPVPVELAHAALPDVPFDKLDLGQRAEFMKQKVIPAMAPLFAKHGTQLMCETCHGKPTPGQDGHYRMPNPKLPKLGDDLSAFKPEDVQWMATEIKPTMAKLLDRPEFSPATPTGFGCSVCHTLEP